MKRLPLLLICLINICNAQQEKKIIPPSPNAAAVAKYGNVPVSYYTGTVNVSVPIYTIQVRDLSLPVSLNYHTGGIKVSEEASRVGLGWALSAGGMISRNIINEDDFASHPNAWLHPQNISPPLPFGPDVQPVATQDWGTVIDFYRTTPAVEYDSMNLTDYIYGATFDFEPDHFNYSFAGHSGRFVVGRDRRPVLEKQEKVTLIPSIDGKVWEARTPDGFKYFFEESEYFIDNQSSTAPQTTAWYLTRIESPLGERIFLEYTTLQEQFIRPVGSYQQRSVPSSFSCEWFACKPSPGKEGPLPRKIYSNVVLSAITWKLGKIEFQRGTRDDLEGDVRIDNIKVYSRRAGDMPGNYELRYDFKLDYSYFDYEIPSPEFTIPDVTDERLRKRLKLESVRKFAPGDSLQEWAYRFGYHEDTDNLRLPAKNSFARDHWGYSSGRDNTSLIPVYQYFAQATSPSDIIGVMGNERDPSADHMPALSLKEITYPTGGSTKFYYEPNDFDYALESPTASAFPRYQQFSYDCQANAGELQSTALDLSDLYVSPSGSPVALDISAAFRSNTTCEGLASITAPYFEIVDENGTLMHRVSLGMSPCADADQRDCIHCDANTGVLTYKSTVSIPRGQYYWRAFSPADETRLETITSSITWYVDGGQQSNEDGASGIGIAGGLRIARIDDFDHVTGQTQTRTFEYRYLEDKDHDGQTELHSYGRRMSIPRYSYFDIFWEAKDQPPIGNVTCWRCINLVRQSDSFTPATGSHGYPVGYSKVIEKFGLNGEGGWTEYEYHNEPDQSLEISQPHLPDTYPIRPPTISTIPHSLNGLQKIQMQFHADGIPQQRTETTYTSKFRKVVYGLDYRRITALNFDLVNYVSLYASVGLYADVITILYPSMQSALIVPAKTSEIHYDSLGNETIKKVTTYAYDNAEHLQLTKTTTETSAGKAISTSTKYAADQQSVASGSPISKMKGDAHMHNVPIEVTMADESTSQAQLLSRSVTVFNDINNHILPEEELVLNNDAPIPLASAPNYSPAPPASTAYRSVATSSYSGEGNLQRISRASDIDVSYQWGYEETLPIAEVKNATNTLLSVSSLAESTSSVAVTMGGPGTVVTQTFQFTSDYPGTVYLKLGVAGSPSYTTVVAVTGLMTGNTVLSVGGCGLTVIPIINVQPGDHEITLTISSENSTEGTGACGEIVFPKHVSTQTQQGIIEFDLENFEEMAGAVASTSMAHTGDRYWSGDYTTTFQPPNNRSYKIEYWYFDTGEWKYKSAAYAGAGMLLAEGTIDDIRIYPSDAQMKTYTYDPIVGMTSAILETGKTIKYEYDVFGRLTVIRDDKGNIEKAFRYEYQSN